MNMNDSTRNNGANPGGTILQLFDLDTESRNAAVLDGFEDTPPGEPRIAPLLYTETVEMVEGLEDPSVFNVLRITEHPGKDLHILVVDSLNEAGWEWQGLAESTLHGGERRSQGVAVPPFSRAFLDIVPVVYVP